MTHRAIFRRLSVAILSVAAACAFAGQDFDDNENGVALDRYDAVSYFTSPEPIRGTRGHLYEYKGSKFYFVSTGNRDKFAQNPERYAPQFGGYCAYGAVRGDRARSHPRAFEIVDDKLYLFSGIAARKEWKKDAGGNIARAAEKWPDSSRLVRKD